MCDWGGSSPRMWGTLVGSLVCRHVIRFIPTHVGNTTLSGGVFLLMPVHPHACGEHGEGTGSMGAPFGSSPRMWGTHDFFEKISDKDRFIPTHVGNTLSDLLSSVDGTVHPHACGEHDVVEVFRPFEGGSSPRMWGTPLKPGTSANPSRFIPTHVGNTSYNEYHYQIAAVHPHACGEHYCVICDDYGRSGSSPRMWGTQQIIDCT